MTEQTQAGGTSQQAGGTGDSNEGQGLVFDAWITEQPEEVRTLLEGHQKGLKSALDSERDARKTLEKQLKDLAGKAEKGSELEEQLNELVTVQAQAEARATFYEEAHAAGITNLKLAWIVVGNDGLMDARGRVNWDSLKKTYPELFGAATRTAPGNAGVGTNKQPGGAASMNDFIRAASGRK